MAINQFDKIALEIANSILTVLELCYTQGVTTTWRDIFLFLRFPEETWKNDLDLDEKIIIGCEQDLVMMREMILSRFSVKH